MNIVSQLLKGGVIGIANLIPGVSGGTMALIMGVYERLIGGIHSISLNTFVSFFKLFTFTKESRDEFAKEMIKIDFIFLLTLFGGALVAVVAFAKLMLLLLSDFHDPTYGFFFGLVLPSVYVPFKAVKRKRLVVFAAIVVGIVVVAGSDFLMSDQSVLQNEVMKYELKLSALQNGAAVAGGAVSIMSLFFLFLAGAGSISAMILPGVSGSFLLLLIGQYFVILKAVTEHDFVSLGVFAVGIVAGLLVFTKFLYFLLAKFHDQTMGFLTGLVAGSLWIIWPFKASAVVGTAAVEGYPETVYLSNTLTGIGMGEFLPVVITFVVGAVLVVGLMVFEQKKGIEK